MRIGLSVGALFGNRVIGKRWMAWRCLFKVSDGVVFRVL